MKKRLGVLSVVTILVMALFALSALASDASMYFATDKNGQNRVTNIQEGDEVWIVISDPDENIDCDIRDKFWTDTKIFDPKTGALLDWESWAEADATRPTVNYVGRAGSTIHGHFFEETGADTGLFVSNRSFQIGRRIDWDVERDNTHWVGFDFDGFDLDDDAFHTYQGDWLYDGLVADPATATAVTFAGQRVDLNILIRALAAPFTGALHGRFENMDTLIGMVVDQNDPTDVAVAMMKIIDTEATITWDQEIYKDANGSATITVVDADENLNCNEVEYVPVFILVNPGSWNPVQTDSNSATNFCMLKRYGGVEDDAGTVGPGLIRWYNIYDSGITAFTPAGSTQPVEDGTYYVEYPVKGDDNVTFFDTDSTTGVTRVSFYAQETGVNTGVFQLNINSILVDLGFSSLRVRDVLVAYYLDPNDEDDFKLATAYIEERQHSITSFTNATRQDQELFWIGRDSVYVQVIDANANVDPCCPEQVVVHICDVHGEDDSEWVILDETSSNSPVFFTNAGMVLDPVWDGMGVGTHPSTTGGYQLMLDNWKLEVFNEDDVYARYNDVYYFAQELGGLGDFEPQSGTAFPPLIDRIRVANDVSFDLMSIADTQVYDGSTTKMYFLDRQGNRVSGYVNSDCVFIEVIDVDQDEDQLRRERVDGFWDANQNKPFGPVAANEWECPKPGTEGVHPVNDLLGDTNIFDLTASTSDNNYAKVYVLNPRSGHWAAVDLLETGVATGDFVSVICVDLTAVYTCVPTLGVLPGDTIVAFYQDPSNHSDSAMISVKVGIGGGGTPPSQASTTMFVDAAGLQVANYTDADMVYVKVIDPSHAGATTLANAVTIEGVKYNVAPLAGAQNDTFITAGLDLGLAAGDTITATYVDPTDPTDSSSDTITVIASVLNVTAFYAGPNPFDSEVSFGYKGSGTASVMSVEVRDLVGHVVWSDEQANVSEIVWNGTNGSGVQLANGGYIYIVTATDGTNTFNGKGTVFINR